MGANTGLDWVACLADSARNWIIPGAESHYVDWFQSA